MDDIRFRIRLNRGRIGIPLDKLGSIAEETERFLKLLDKDISMPEGEWIASRFTNGSLAYDTVRVGAYAQEDSDKFNTAFQYIIKTDPDMAKTSNGLVSYETMVQYAAIAKHIDPDEKIEFGVYNGNKRPKWNSLTKNRADRIVKLVQRSVEYFGEICGTVNSLFKGVDDPHFTLRDILTGNLIRCDYNDDIYGDVHRAIERNDALVYVSGFIKANIFYEQIESIKTTAIKAAPILSNEDYKAFFGCAPNMIADCANGE